MRTLLVVCLFLLLAANVAAAATAQVEIQNGTIVATMKNKELKFSAKDFPLVNVENAELRFTTVGEAQAKESGLDEGVYIFAPTGKLAAFLPMSGAEFCSRLSLSPNGTVLAVDFGVTLVREWSFYSWPTLKKLSKVPAVYFSTQERPGLIWVNDTAVLLATMNTKSGRQCGYDPCGSLSVTLYTIANSKTTTVLKGTDLCDYTPRSLSNGTITASKLCLPSVTDWKEYPEDIPVQTIAVPLP